MSFGNNRVNWQVAAKIQPRKTNDLDNRMWIIKWRASATFKILGLYKAWVCNFELASITEIYADENCLLNCLFGLSEEYLVIIYFVCAWRRSLKVI